MSTADLCWMPATELVALIRARKLSPVELTDRASPPGRQWRAGAFWKWGGWRGQDLAVPVKDQMVFDGFSQGPERADDALAVFPHHARLVADDALPEPPVVRAPSENHFLDAVAQLDVCPGG